MHVDGPSEFVAGSHIGSAGWHGWFSMVDHLHQQISLD